VGANICTINPMGEIMYELKFPETYKEISKKMYLNSMVVHSCAMFRTEILNTIGFYPTEYKAAEDYAYFFKILEKYQIYNIQESLVFFQIDETGISATKRNLQLKSRLKIILKHFYWGFWPIYGLTRNILLFIVPNKLIKNVKKFIYTK